jgi:antitoxin ParD1/3/4
VVLTAHHEDVIRSLVESGRYQNASEVLREGLRLLEAQEERAAARLSALREAARIGFADLEEGHYRDFESVDDLADYLRDLSEQAGSGVRRG